MLIPFVSQCDKQAIDFLDKLLRYDHQDRLTAKEAMVVLWLLFYISYLSLLFVFPLLFRVAVWEGDGCSSNLHSTNLIKDLHLIIYFLPTKYWLVLG